MAYEPKVDDIVLLPGAFGRPSSLAGRVIETNGSLVRAEYNHGGKSNETFLHVHEVAPGRPLNGGWARVIDHPLVGWAVNIDYSRGPAGSCQLSVSYPPVGNQSVYLNEGGEPRWFSLHELVLVKKSPHEAPPKEVAATVTPNAGQYSPRVGDLARWGSLQLQHLVVVEECLSPRASMVEVLVDGGTGSTSDGRGHADNIWLTPVRPTYVGQRARHVNGGDGVITHVPNTIRGYFVLHYDTPRDGHDAVVSLEHEFVAQQTGPTSNDGRLCSQILSGFADPGSVTVEQAAEALMLRWTERGEKFSMATPTAKRFADWICTTSQTERREIAREISTSNAVSPPAEPHARQNICPLHSTTMRKKGETRGHWWLCGCEVKPEGEDFLGLVNGEPRGMFVWGHGTYATGFMREEAVSKWRAKLIKHQEIDDDYGGPDDAKHPSHPDRVTAAVAEFAARKAKPSS